MIIDAQGKVKYYTQEQWELKNPVLLAGEIGIQPNNILEEGVPPQIIKIGDGHHAWSQLPTFEAPSSGGLAPLIVEIAKKQVTYNGSESISVIVPIAGAAKEFKPNVKKEYGLVTNSSEINFINGEPLIQKVDIRKIVQLPKDGKETYVILENGSANDKRIAADDPFNK